MQRALWGFWRYRVQYSRIGRTAMARIMSKAKLEAFTQWRLQARSMAINKGKVRGRAYVSGQGQA